MNLLIQLPLKFADYLAVWTISWAVLVGLVGFGAGFVAGYRLGEHDTSRALAPDIQANADLLNTLSDRLIYLQEWATFETLASHYGGHHNGRLTASGTVFDENELTAASPWLPFGKRVRVTNIKNGLSVTVVVTDRGPAPRLGRGIDLSTAAARELNMLNDGVVKVRIEPGL